MSSTLARTVTRRCTAVLRGIAATPSSSSSSSSSSSASFTQPRSHQLQQRRTFATTTTPVTDCKADDAKYIVGTYARLPVEFERGSGCIMYDINGKEYIDFYSGIAVNALGHADPDWTAAVTKHANKLCHVSNLFFTREQTQLAKALVDNSTFDKVFFCNSGTEANEAALKFARKYAYVHAGSKAHKKTKIVAFNGGFHGRTIGSLSMTYKQQYKTPFYPLMGSGDADSTSVTFLPYNDVAALKDAITDETCMVIVEPIQGEGGVNPATKEFITAIRSHCDAVGALMVVDEVQCGLGRTGALWAHTTYGVEPDMMTLAKPLAGGLPIGAVLVRQKVADVMKPGDHGTTFAGAPLITAAALATFEKINTPNFLNNVQATGRHLVTSLQMLQKKLNTKANKAAKPVEITAIRSSIDGGGLLIGVDLTIPVSDVVIACLRHGLVLITAGEKTLRLCPPLIVTTKQVDAAVQMLERALNDVEQTFNKTQ